MFLVPTRPFPFGWQNGPIFSLPPPYARAVKFSIPPPSLVWLADDAAGTRAECLLTLPQAYTRAHRRVRASRLKDIPGLRGLSQADVCPAAQEWHAGIKPRLWSFDSRRTVSLSSLSSLFLFFSKRRNMFQPRPASVDQLVRSGAACQATTQALSGCGLAPRNAHWL